MINIICNMRKYTLTNVVRNNDLGINNMCFDIRKWI